MGDRFGMQGKLALVTGAGSGLGAHFARTLAEAGASVVLAGRRLNLIESGAQALRQEGKPAWAVSMDVCDEASVRAGFDQIADQAGVPDVVVCNAGVAVNRNCLDLSAHDWRQVIDTNLTGCWLVACEWARRLIEAGKRGALVNISSILAHRVAGAVLPYTASKAALEQMTRGLALEWARHGIRVNALAPGYIETDLNQEFFATAPGQAMLKRIPQRRLGQAADLDGALLLLASDASAYMTGSTVVVDGGHLQSSL